jgi:hypothetical protein
MRRTVIALAIGTALILAGAGAHALAEGASPLDHLMNNGRSIVMDFKETPVSEVLKAIAGTGSFKLTLGKGFQDSKVTIPKGERTIKAMLESLAKEKGFVYTVPNPKELVVERPGE